VKDTNEYLRFFMMLVTSGLLCVFTLYSMWPLSFIFIWNSKNKIVINVIGRIILYTILWFLWIYKYIYTTNSAVRRKAYFYHIQFQYEILIFTCKTCSWRVKIKKIFIIQSNKILTSVTIWNNLTIKCLAGKYTENKRQSQQDVLVVKIERSL